MVAGFLGPLDELPLATTFVTTSPGVDDFTFIPRTTNGKATLVLRDAQHEYAFTAE